MGSEAIGRFWIAALACLLAHAALADETFLSDAEAPRAVFPDADRFAAQEIPSTPELRARVAERLGEVQPSIWEPSYRIATAFVGEQPIGRAIEVEEIGKHRAITLVVGVDAAHKIAAVAVMTYREAYGGEIRSKRFLAQYRGKGERDPLLPSRDIQNISGATLSARAVGRAVKKAIAVLEEAGAPAAAGESKPLPAPPPEAASPSRVREAYYVMGTMLEITVDVPSAEVGRAWIRRAAAEARRLDHELSSFDPESPLTRLNQAAGLGPHAVSADLYQIVDVSKALSRESAGTFDITVSPLVSLWSRAAIVGRLPSAADVERVRSYVGSDRIALVPPDAIDLPRGSALELGGIGKGYAADRMAEILRRMGATSALVNFGGSSIVAVGPPAASPAWPVWLRRGDCLDGPLRLRDIALSTSGSLGQSERVNGRRFGHIIDPRSGRPLERAAQATVLAPTGTEAEAWSKSLLVDPEGAPRRMTRHPGVSFVMFSGVRRVEGGRFAAISGRRLFRR